MVESYLRLGASPGAALALTQMNAEIDVRDVLPLVRVPTLVLHRSGDRCLHVDEGRYVASLVPGAQFVELPGDDHLPFVGDQDAMVDQIAAFLKSVTDGPATGSRPRDSALRQDRQRPCRRRGSGCVQRARPARDRLVQGPRAHVHRRRVLRRLRWSRASDRVCPCPRRCLPALRAGRIVRPPYRRVRCHTGWTHGGRGVRTGARRERARRGRGPRIAHRHRPRGRFRRRRSRIAAPIRSRRAGTHGGSSR